MVVFQQTETHCDITMHYLYLTTPAWANQFLKTASMNLDLDVVTLKTPFCHLVVVSLFVSFAFPTCIFLPCFELYIVQEGNASKKAHSNFPEK